MFVVRVEVDDETDDWKAFTSLADAHARLELGRAQTILGEFDSITVYEVIGIDNARDAVAAVKAGAAGPLAKSIRLVEQVESSRRAMSKLTLDLSAITGRRE